MKHPTSYRTKCLVLIFNFGIFQTAFQPTNADTRPETYEPHQSFQKAIPLSKTKWRNIRPPIFQEYTRKITSASPIDYGSDSHPWERRRRNLKHSGVHQQKHQNDHQQLQNQQKQQRSDIENILDHFDIQPESPLLELPEVPVIYQDHPWKETTDVNATDGFDVTEEDYAPIRLSFHTGSLTELGDTHEYGAKVEALTTRVLPLMAGNFTQSLKVFPVQGNIPLKRSTFFDYGTCFGIYDNFITSWDMDPGIANTDLVVMVSAFKNLAGIEICSETEGAGGVVTGTLAAATGCELDQYDRPITGLVNFCLDLMDVEADGSISQEVVDLFVSVAMHEFTHVLGINSDMMKYYRDVNTGEPLTSRPFTTEPVSCAPSGATQQTVLPSCNTLRPTKTSRGFLSYLVVLPTVTQVARNQFNCQTLEGAMMENQPTNPYDCFGSHFDERDFYSETMSAFFAQEADYYSPLSLALLQDSGWYRPNYRVAEVSPFGLGAGCDFVKNDCIVNGEVPAYSKGFFCNEKYEEGRFLCDPSATHKAICDLFDGIKIPQSHSYFPNPKTGPYFDRADFCPIARESTINCAEKRKSLSGEVTIDFFGEQITVEDTSLPEEMYAEGSKCFERVDGDALCLEAFCSSEPRVLTVKVGSQIFTCNSDFQHISYTSTNGQVIQFICPRLSAACPELFCPANCSGKGVCNFAGRVPVCECFDQNDATEGCYNSSPSSPDACENVRSSSSSLRSHTVQLSNSKSGSKSLLFPFSAAALSFAITLFEF